MCSVGQKIRTGEGQNSFPHGGRSKSFLEKSDMIHCVFFVMGYQGPDKVRRDLKIQVDWRQKFRTGSRGRSKSFLEKSDMIHCVWFVTGYTVHLWDRVKCIYGRQESSPVVTRS